MVAFLGMWTLILNIRLGKIQEQESGKSQRMQWPALLIFLYLIFYHTWSFTLNIFLSKIFVTSERQPGIVKKILGSIPDTDNQLWDLGLITWPFLYISFLSFKLMGWLVSKNPFWLNNSVILSIYIVFTI